MFAIQYFFWKTFYRIKFYVRWVLPLDAGILLIRIVRAL